MTEDKREYTPRSKKKNKVKKIKENSWIGSLLASLGMLVLLAFVLILFLEIMGIDSGIKDIINK